MRLPVLRDGRWQIALLPNMVGTSDEDVSEQVGQFYDLLAVRERMGVELTAADVRNLKAVLPAGSGIRTMLDYLIAKFASRETREKLGYTAAREKSLVSRYDTFVSELHERREQAYLKVGGKVIKRTGQPIKDIERAVENGDFLLVENFSRNVFAILSLFDLILKELILEFDEIEPERDIFRIFLKLSVEIASSKLENFDFIIFVEILFQVSLLENVSKLIQAS